MVIKTIDNSPLRVYTRFSSKDLKGDVMQTNTQTPEVSKYLEVISNLVDQFETKEKGNDTIVVTKDNASQKLQDAIHEAHPYDCLPNDWIYQIFYRILVVMLDYKIETIEDFDECRHELVDSLVDIYNFELTKWLHFNSFALEYLEEAIDERGFSKDDGIIQVLQYAQYLAIDEIYTCVANLITSLVEA